MTTTPETGGTSGWARNPIADVSVRMGGPLSEVGAAVDVQDLAGEEARVVAGEEQRHRRDVALGISQPADRTLGHRAGEALGITRRPVLAALRPGARGDRIRGD